MRHRLSGACAASTSRCAPAWMPSPPSTPAAPAVGATWMRAHTEDDQTAVTNGECLWDQNTLQSVDRCPVTSALQSRLFPVDNAALAAAPRL
jgi:hypothetical protein